MQLTERHIIKKTHKHYREIDRLCFLSKNLYNVANYLIRQSFFKTGEILNYNQTQKLLQSQFDYKNLPAKVSQQILMILDKNWKAFFQAQKAYQENPSKFLGKPKLPKYKHKENGRNLLVYTIQALSKPFLCKGLIKLSQTEIVFPTQAKKIAQVRIIPKLNHYVIEVIYHQEEKPKQVDNKRIASIDLGLNNLATVTFNQAGLIPFLINGRPLKSINHFFNKKKAELQAILKTTTSKRLQNLCIKRNFKVDDYLHKASRYLINKLVELNIGTLVIGKNEGWKQELNIGSKNNQNFTQIPHTRFIEQLTYKAELEGISVIITEESYTSKSSFLDQDVLPTYKKGENHSFSGKRIKRGLYKSAQGILVNADVNGSLNILRKAIPNAFADGIKGIVVSPVKVTLSK
ncbi:MULTISPECIES: RNA-guided endonuclease TnpB family protein [unclassified Dolichospermum]|uniref:RNA-guided endonuclease InsQ/TnpB family protein n=2 Tax=Dolichospermum TaxID=748770 RepID=UPI0014474E83|nr:MULTISPECIES: RNA-guided endonuclease TnpB family protein [unclassified Dolichospermum]MTJ17181.1 IS200/IS605 family element transposase accessory protein TnpB [Dolichospermum sp. UHCC 0299]MTJ21488.1 IS200/IS605 family element transposase accessory protein TnpB [Dolichospermum sp. UHCC 0352]